MPIPETPQRILNDQNLPARVYEVLKDHILRGLLPSGAKLYEDKLASGETLEDPEGVSAYPQADLRFHLALRDACGNRELT
ncbi:MAG: hypothetical protein ACE5HK_03075 [Candidatus Methylomirabilales bacterium]